MVVNNGKRRKEFGGFSLLLFEEDFKMRKVRVDERGSKLVDMWRFPSRLMRYHLMQGRQVTGGILISKDNILHVSKLNWHHVYRYQLIFFYFRIMPFLFKREREIKKKRDNLDHKKKRDGVQLYYILITIINK